MTQMKDTNPKAWHGIVKPQLHLVPPSAMLHLSMAFHDGAHKYGPYNWRTDPVSATTYISAMQRHMLDYLDGEEFASDSGVMHLAHIMACCAILIDARECNTLIDDRPRPGPAPEIIERLKTQLEAKERERKGLVQVESSTPDFAPMENPVRCVVQHANQEFTD